MTYSEIIFNGNNILNQLSTYFDLEGVNFCLHRDLIDFDCRAIKLALKFFDGSC